MGEIDHIISSKTGAFTHFFKEHLHESVRVLDIEKKGSIHTARLSNGDRYQLAPFTLHGPHAIITNDTVHNFNEIYAVTKIETGKPLHFYFNKSLRHILMSAVGHALARFHQPGNAHDYKISVARWYSTVLQLISESSLHLNERLYLKHCFLTWEEAMQSAHDRCTRIHSTLTTSTIFVQDGKIHWADIAPLYGDPITDVASVLSDLILTSISTHGKFEDPYLSLALDFEENYLKNRTDAGYHIVLIPYLASAILVQTVGTSHEDLGMTLIRRVFTYQQVGISELVELCNLDMKIL